MRRIIWFEKNLKAPRQWTVTAWREPPDAIFRTFCISCTFSGCLGKYCILLVVVPGGPVTGVIVSYCSNFVFSTHNVPLKYKLYLIYFCFKQIYNMILFNMKPVNGSHKKYYIMIFPNAFLFAYFLILKTIKRGLIGMSIPDVKEMYFRKRSNRQTSTEVNVTH